MAEGQKPEMTLVFVSSSRSDLRHDFTAGRIAGQVSGKVDWHSQSAFESMEFGEEFAWQLL
jgi:hypothetical protein